VTPIIEFRKVSKAFGNLVVLDKVDLRIEAEQTTVIIGESGAGKSVALKHTMSLLRPDSGEVYFKGQRIDRLDEQELADVRRHFGFLFQMGALFDSMSAGDNVAFPLREHSDLPEEDINRVVAEKLDLVGLAGVKDKKPAMLSGGQRKRVALARAIALNPEVILYDEPTTGLDPVRAAGINNLIVKLNREMGITSLVVTHDMASVRTVGHRVLMLHHGKFIFDGTVQELDTCEDDVVRRFVEGRADDDSNGA
jgi:phospholipid/cholesterol/gamma-HCH transport system ATP-binding protein